MKKRILITTILATVIVGFGANAFAKGEARTIAGYRKTAPSLETIIYNPKALKPYKIQSDALQNGRPQGHGYSETDYTSLKEVYPVIYKAIKGKSAIAIDLDSITPLLTAVVNDTNGLATQLHTLTRNNGSNVTKDQIQQEARELLTKKTGGVNFLRKKLGLTNAVLTKYHDAKPTKNASEELKDVNSLVDNLENQYNDLTIEMSGTEDQINSSKEVGAFRNDSNTQETLKKAVNHIKKTASSTDANHKAEAKAILDSLEEKSDILFADPKKVSVANLPHVQKPDTHATSSMLNTSIATSVVLNDRMNGFTGFGVASGDEAESYGAWIKGNFGTGTQRAFKSESGYSYTQKGVTIGVDAGDESMIGAAYSFFQNDVKNKTSASAKDKINTHMFSVYGLYSIQPEIFVSGQASYGISDISKSRATGDVGNHTAKAKTKGNTMAARAEVGYVYTIDESMAVVPTIGFAHTSVDVNGYSEKGDGLNRKIAKRTSTRTSGLAGVSLKHTSSADFSQEVHANIDYAFSAKNPETKITLVDGLTPLRTPSEKASKAYYNVGGSVKVNAAEMVDIIAGYDLGLAKKFMSHTGTLKLRINF